MSVDDADGTNGADEAREALQGDGDGEDEPRGSGRNAT